MQPHSLSGWPRALLPLEALLDGPRLRDNALAGLAALEQQGFTPWIVAADPALAAQLLARSASPWVGAITFDPGAARPQDLQLVMPGSTPLPGQGETLDFSTWAQVIALLRQRQPQQLPASNHGIVRSTAVAASGRLDARFHLLLQQNQSQMDELQATLPAEQAQSLIQELPLPLRRQLYTQIAVGSKVAQASQEMVDRHLERNPYLALALAAQALPAYLQEQREKLQQLTDATAHVRQLQQNLQQHMGATPSPSRKASP